jgi:DNA-binding transcriptional MerR regulator
MRISELSRASGVSIPTIKFYLRENLLPQGTATARTQADYPEAHLRRLRLIQALTGIGGLKLRDVRDVLRPSTTRRSGPTSCWGRSTSPRPPSRRQPFARRGPGHCRRGPVRRRAGVAGQPGGSRPADAGPRPADAPAHGPRRRRHGVRALRPRRGPARQPRGRHRLPDGIEARGGGGHVVGTVVFGAALLALRRLAQEHHSGLRFGEADGPSVGGCAAPIRSGRAGGSPCPRR